MIVVTTKTCRHIIQCLYLLIFPQKGDVGLSKGEGHAGYGLWEVEGFSSISPVLCLNHPFTSTKLCHIPMMQEARLQSRLQSTWQSRLQSRLQSTLQSILQSRWNMQPQPSAMCDLEITPSQQGHWILPESAWTLRHLAGSYNLMRKHTNVHDA